MCCKCCCKCECKKYTPWSQIKVGEFFRSRVSPEDIDLKINNSGAYNSIRVSGSNCGALKIGGVVYSEYEVIPNPFK